MMYRYLGIMWICSIFLVYFFSKARCLLRSIINLCLKHQWNIRSFWGNINSPEQIHFQHSMKDMRFFLPLHFNISSNFGNFRCITRALFPLKFTYSLRFNSIQLCEYRWAEYCRFMYARVLYWSVPVIARLKFNLLLWNTLKPSLFRSYFTIRFRSILQHFGFPKKIHCTYRITYCLRYSTIGQ